ncbi:MAG: T9SS type A sorting domain-containing protein [Bacteroidales bacterium]|nr:T9SS type A sorting domain-containing protein [Bacteroidales bacterium]MBN2750646.1 T9SS type A sorting domain-containing protein [Bacteroidales bacterium]
MRQLKWYQVVVALLLITSSAAGQEVLIPLETMPSHAAPTSKAKAKSAKGSLPLPFFDDFAKPHPLPDAARWETNGVLVNSNYAINPPSIGVASFDIINLRGEIYSHINTTSSNADVLTSHPINLSYPGDLTIYLSFAYQPQGLGRSASETDSLAVDFYDTANDQWVNAWRVSANSSNNTLTETNRLEDKTRIRKDTEIKSKFFNVALPVYDEKYLKDGFRFRFRNLASISENAQDPARTNGDNWHIDLVYLNRNRYEADTIPNDIAISKPIKSILTNYTSIPWSHVKQSSVLQAELANRLEFPISYRNLGPTTWNVTRRFEVLNHSTNETYAFSGGAENIYAFQDFDFTRYYVYNFSSAWNDSARFTFKSYLITDFEEETKHFRQNDTTTYTQEFKNYYAYDDGSSEMGYGLYGDGSQNGMVALKYNTYTADKLTGVKIYFNRSYKDSNQQFFKLTVWESNNGTPGKKLYEKTGVKPLFRDSLNQFTLYKIDEDITLNGEFFVGWGQTTKDLLNVGFDKNNEPNSKLYYNLYGYWQTTEHSGALMVRPVFGELTESPTTIDDVRDTKLSIYPNPASTVVKIAGDFTNSINLIRIFNLSGQVVLEQQIHNGEVNVEHLSQGTYILQALMRSGHPKTAKLVILR